MSKFLTQLSIVNASNKDDGNWRMAQDLVYQSDLVAAMKLPQYPEGIMVIPKGTATDLASVPRFPLVYLLFGGTSHEAAALHDGLYQLHYFDRATSDAILREASEATGVAKWRRWMMWAGVRVGGGSHWDVKETAGKPLQPPADDPMIG